MMNKRNFMLGTAGAVAALPALSIPPASGTTPGLRALLGLPAIAVNADAQDWAACLSVLVSPRRPNSLPTHC